MVHQWPIVPVDTARSSRPHCPAMLAIAAPVKPELSLEDDEPVGWDEAGQKTGCQNSWAVVDA